METKSTRTAEAGKVDNPRVVISLGMPLPLSPEPLAPKGLEYWDWDKLIPLEADCRSFLELLVKFWFTLLPAYRDSLELHWFQATPPKRRELVIQVISTDAEQQDAFSDTENSISGVLTSETRDLFRVITEYTRLRVETGLDTPIKVFDPKSGDTSAICSLNAAVVDAAQDLFMQDARRVSQRPSMTVSLGENETIVIPAALGRYAFSETEGRLEVVGYFDELSDSRGQGVLRQPDKKETYPIKIQPELRQGTAAAYFRRTLVRATLSKTVYSIAGSRKSRGYVLIDFRKVDDTFAEKNEFHDSRETLDLFHQDRRTHHDRDHEGPERRTQSDHS